MIITVLLSLCITASFFLCVAAAFVKYREGRHCAPLLFFAAALSAMAAFGAHQTYIIKVLSLYPLFFVYFINAVKQLTKKDLGIFAAAQIAALMSLFGASSIIPVVIGLVNMYAIVIINKSISFKHGTTSLQLMLTVQSLLLFIFSYMGDVYSIVMSITGFCLLFVIIITYDISKRTYTALSKIRTLSRMNAHLTKMTRLLKQRNDQYVAMLNKKDNDIQLLSKYSTMAEITASIAHEVAQPLTGIKSIAQNMIDDIQLDEFNYLEALSQLQKICTMVDKATYIIDHIRSFNTSNHIYKFIDINSVIMNTVALINNQLKKYNIDVILILNDAIPKIYGNSISIEQILLNLITNARDAIVEKSKKEGTDYAGRIIIKSDSDDDFVTIIVDDNGIGIQPEIQKHIWSPFFTTKRYSQSLGIGLSISKKIISDHNGHIHIDSKINEGTLFTIKFSLSK